MVVAEATWSNEYALKYRKPVATFLATATAKLQLQFGHGLKHHGVSFSMVALHVVLTTAVQCSDHMPAQT